MFRFILVSFLFLASNLWAQDRTISGTVSSDEDGSGLPGVNVILQGTTVGTTTDVNGSYSLGVPSDGGTLVFSFIGLASQEVAIGARSVVDVVMSSDVEELQEVVVTALGITKEKAALGYAVTSVGGEQLEARPEADIARLSLIHISEPTRRRGISYAVFCLKKKKNSINFHFFFQISNY